MNEPRIISQDFQINSAEIENSSVKQLKINIWKKLRGGFFLVLGYLLSPLCWWNDLLFNLPIAYFFGYLCSLLSPKLLVPCTIISYWLSNVLGMLLMQFGTGDIFRKETQENNWRKELLTTLVSSTVYTLVIVLLIQCKIIDTPVLLGRG
jgi:Zn-dependent protease with chaperone function